MGYTYLAGDLAVPLAAACVGPALLAAVAERYESQWPHCSLVEFVQSGAAYLFDLASAGGGGQEDRTVAAWAVTPATVAKRDVSYQRGSPLPPDPDGALVDRDIPPSSVRRRIRPEHLPPAPGSEPGLVT